MTYTITQPLNWKYTSPTATLITCEKAKRQHYNNSSSHFTSQGSLTTFVELKLK